MGDVWVDGTSKIGFMILPRDEKAFPSMDLGMMFSFAELKVSME